MRLALIGLLLVAGCSQPAAPPPAAPAPAATSQPTATPAATSQPTPAPVATSQPTAAPVAAAKPTAAAPPQTSTDASVVRLTLATEGTEARFRAREQLARRNLPSEAVGSTRDVAGTIGVGPNGIVAEGSTISVRLDSLATDDRQRDRFIKDNTLQIRRFPTAEFVPRAAQGLSWPLPTSGDGTFQLQGDLTVHGVTAPSTWDVTAKFSPNEISGTGRTNVTLDQFGMQKPSVMTVLSIDDTIVLEIDFRAVR
jgi:polyisoprenoid-binding protein YceI